MCILFRTTNRPSWFPFQKIFKQFEFAFKTMWAIDKDNVVYFKDEIFYDIERESSLLT